MQEVRIPYRPNKLLFVGAILLFGFGSVFFCHLAATNDRGLILNGIIRFSSQGATVFYWVLFAISSSFVAVGLAALVSSLMVKREIVLTATSISSPKNGFTKAVVQVDFSDITGVQLQTVQGTKLLYIHHTGGTLTIPNSMVSGKESFEKLVELMKRCVQS